MGPVSFRWINIEYPDQDERDDVDLDNVLFKPFTVQCSGKKRKSNRRNSGKEETEDKIRLYVEKDEDMTCNDKDFKEEIEDADDMELGLPSDNLDCDDDDEQVSLRFPILLTMRRYAKLYDFFTTQFHGTVAKRNFNRLFM